VAPATERVSDQWVGDEPSHPAVVRAHELPPGHDLREVPREILVEVDVHVGDLAVAREGRAVVEPGDEVIVVEDDEVVLPRGDPARDLGGEPRLVSSRKRRPKGTNRCASAAPA
jgi:hypothetical protein